MSGQDKRIAALILLFFSLLYLATAKGRIQNGDTVFSVRTANSIIERRTLLIAAGSEDALPMRGFTRRPRRKDELIYSKYGIGLPILFIPLLLLAKGAAFVLQTRQAPFVDLVISLYNVLFGAGACALMYALSLRFTASRRDSCLLALLMGAATIAWHYSVSDFSEAAQMFLMLLNYARFGSVLESGYGGPEDHGFEWGKVGRAARLLFSLDKGLCVYSPLSALGLLGYLALWRRHPREAQLFGSLIALNLLLFAAWWFWRGGWSWGPRLLVPMTPLHLPPLCYLLIDKRGLRIATLAAAVSFPIQLLSVSHNYHDYLSIRRAILDKRAAEAPPAIAGALIMLKHRALEGDAKFRLSEFGAQVDAVADFSDKPFFWSGLLARRLPALRYFPVFLLAPLALILRRQREAVLDPSP